MMQKHCLNHTSRPALNLCRNCREYFCADCLVEGSEYYYCHAGDCQAALTREQLPSSLNCPNCKEELALSAKERSSRFFLCPSCKHTIDYGEDDGTLVRYRIAQKNQAPSPDALDDSLPGLLRCPHCDGEVELSDDERSSKQFTCPLCNKPADYTTDRISLQKFRESQHKSTRPILFPASDGKRFVNWLLDGFIAAFVNGASLGVISTTSEMLFGEVSFVFVFIAYLILPFTYFFVGESSLQKTPAKYITKTRVVNEDGSKPGRSVILKRTMYRFVPFEILSGSEGTWWHDRRSGTMVIDD